MAGKKQTRIPRYKQIENDLIDKIQMLWRDKERLKQYSENCHVKRFDTVEEYCEKLLLLYQAKV